MSWSMCLQVCMVLVQLASWLEMAHKTGFAHRNLKPSNVIQLSGSQNGNITVTDFGRAARIGAAPQLLCFVNECADVFDLHRTLLTSHATLAIA
jgi:serine/threonine protein kinase